MRLVNKTRPPLTLRASVNLMNDSQHLDPSPRINFILSCSTIRVCRTTFSLQRSSWARLCCTDHLFPRSYYLFCAVHIVWLAHGEATPPDNHQFPHINELQQGGLEARKWAGPPWNRTGSMVVNGANRLLWLLLFSRFADTLLHYGRLKSYAISNAC